MNPVPSQPYVAVPPCGSRIGQQAVVLIRLDARRGETVSVADLASHTMLSAAQVRATIEALWHLGYALPVREGQGAPTNAQIVGATACGAMPSCD